jgi:hypothetical protein
MACSVWAYGKGTISIWSNRVTLSPLVQRAKRPPFDGIRRAVKRISYQRIGAGKVSIAPHIGDDRRRFGAEPRVKGIW